LKKFLAILFSALFVLSFAASAFAIHAEIPAETQAAVAKGTTQITLGGEVRTRGWYRSNFAGGLGVDTNGQAWYDQRVRLNVEAVVAPGVTGYVQVESHSGSDGDKYKWGNQTALGVGKTSSGAGGTNAKPAAYLDILQSWIVYSGSGLFGFNSGVKVGHMPLKLAYGQFFDNTQYGDDALVFFMDPTKQLHIGLLTFKGLEGNIADNTDDLDAYVGLAVYKLDDKNALGINYTYINNSDMLLKLQNLGLHADGNVAGLGYKAAVDFQFGSVGSGTSKADFGGYALSAGVNYNAKPANLRAAFVMGSGDSNKLDNKLKEFVAFTGNIQNYSFIYEYQHTTTAGAYGTGSGLNSGAASDGHAAGVANTTYFNLGVDYAATKDLGLSADAYILRASKVPSGSKTAGWEVDAKMKYALAKNLSYQIDAGYFAPGAFYKDAYGVDKKAVTALRHALTLTF